MHIIDAKCDKRGFDMLETSIKSSKTELMKYFANSNVHNLLMPLLFINEKAEIYKYI